MKRGAQTHVLGHVGHVRLPELAGAVLDEDDAADEDEGGEGEVEEEAGAAARAAGAGVLLRGRTLMSPAADAVFRGGRGSRSGGLLVLPLPSSDFA